MTRANWKFVVALAVCTLLPLVSASAKDKVTRPFQMAANSQLVIVVDPQDPAYGTYTAHAEGVASHLGEVVIDEAGIIVAPVFEGTMKAANGDLVTYEYDNGQFQIRITGGTRRFTGASGTFTLNVQLAGPPVLDPVAGTMTYNFIWTGSGTITY